MAPGGIPGHCLRCLLLLGVGSEQPSSDPLQCPELSDPTLSTPRGQRIGSYTLLEKIGEGGCGVVFLAEQQAPVSRRVALKIIKLGMDTKQVVARFKVERQTLALMDHPNIARIFDAGATEAGRLYFVMELVKGIKITDYCDQHKLTIQQRLVLFRQVCHAVQHAHQKGIIHRDLKPSNILIAEQEGAPVPKVIDFGIAKATTDELGADTTILTAFEQFIGTPAYMSPEQAAMGGVDIDTRSDIYSLGVLLYELLAGQPPFDSLDLRRRPLNQVIQIIREKEAPRLSASLTSQDPAELAAVAFNRQMDPIRLRKTLAVDLDWIVMKALEKDRTRRYETAASLAADVKNFESDKPVGARPPASLYLLGKWARRHKVLFAGASGLLIFFLSVVIAEAVQWLVAAHKSHVLLATQSAAARRDESDGRFDAFAAVARGDSNPNGAWSYGSSPALGALPTLYSTEFTDAAMTNVPHAWTHAWTDHPGPIPIPFVAANLFGPATSDGPTNLLRLHPGWECQFTHVIWTAPASGRYSLATTFTLLDLKGNTVCYVLHRTKNGLISMSADTLDADHLSSYFSHHLEVAAGEQIDFAVGCGPRGVDGDSTGLSAVITRMSKKEPANP